MQPQTIKSDYDFLLKVLLIGNASVGKSNLLLRFSDNTFQETSTATIGVDFKIRTLEILQKAVKLQIWDTAGQERFKMISASYYKGAHGIILVYDITKKQSFKNIENWVAEAGNFNESSVKLLVGNKTDLEEKREVSKEEGEQMASSLGVQFLETSAKDNVNVEKAFVTLAEQIIMEKIQKEEEAKAIIMEKEKVQKEEQAEAIAMEKVQKEEL